MSILKIKDQNNNWQSIPAMKGDPGVSPAVTVDTIQGGHRVNITDAEHPQGQSFDVMDGQDGGISDAPSNGKAYVRKDGEWVEGVEKSEVEAIGTKVGDFEASTFLKETMLADLYNGASTYFSSLEVAFTSDGFSTENTTGTNKTVQVSISQSLLAAGKQYALRFINQGYSINGLYNGSTLIAKAEDDGEYKKIVFQKIVGTLILSVNHNYNVTSSSVSDISIKEADASAAVMINEDKIENIGTDNFSAQFNDWVDDTDDRLTALEGGGASSDVLLPLQNHLVLVDSDIVVVSSTSGCSISITDGDVHISNTSGANRFFGITLNRLNVAYGEMIKVKLKKSAGSIVVKQGMTATNNGTELATFSEDGEYLSATFAYNKNRGIYITAWSNNTAIDITEINVSIVGEVAKFNGKYNTDGSDLEKYACSWEGNEISVFSSILCIGDSLTAGVMNYNETGATQFVTMAKYSYPTKLKQLTGVETTNKGVGGITSVGWYQQFENEDLSGYDMAIVQLGVNDAIQYQDWTQESQTAFGNIVTKLKTENNNIKIFVSNIIRARGYYGSQYDNVSNGIKSYVEGLNDSNVILLDMHSYGNVGNIGAYDGGHLTALGYSRLAQDYKSYISWYIAHHPDIFREVQFIGTNHTFNK